MGRKSEAERLYQQATLLSPDSWGGCNEFGAFYLRHNENEKAAQQFRRAVELTPDNALAHGNLGLALDELGRPGEAQAELKKSIELQPTYPALTMLGRLYYRQRLWPDAAAMVEQALQLNRTDYRVWANLAAAYEWLDQPDKADAAYAEELARLETVAKLTPEDAEMLSHLGVLYARQHLRDKAIPRIEAALARAPDRADILSNAADVYECLGDRTRALALIKKAIAKGTTRDEIERDPALRNLRLDPRFRQFAVNASKAAPHR
jgi:Flp pilus assembly protein TadD